jgi:hypothetical protein
VDHVPQKSLIILEFRYALAVEIGETEFDGENFSKIKNMISVYGGLVIVDEKNNIIRLIYYTIWDYFKRTQIS